MSACHYRLFGLPVASDIALEGVAVAAVGSPELVIAKARLDHPALDRDQSDQFIVDGQDQYFYWKAVGLFRVAGANRIEVDPIAGVPDRLIALPLLGTVVAALLVRRGLSVLHASAVSVEGQAVIVLGHKGAGKSTTATTLVTSGCQLVSDDVVALQRENNGFLILPAYGLVKLWKDSARQLDPSGGRRLWQLHEAVDKAHFQLGDNLAAAPLPVARLYLLERGSEPGVAKMPASQALPAALEHAYMARFGVDGFAGTLPQHFAMLGELAGAGLIRRLTVPDDLTRLDEIPALVRDDLHDRAARQAAAQVSQYG